MREAFWRGRRFHLREGFGVGNGRRIHSQERDRNYCFRGSPPQGAPVSARATETAIKAPAQLVAAQKRQMVLGDEEGIPPSYGTNAVAASGIPHKHTLRPCERLENGIIIRRRYPRHSLTAPFEANRAAHGFRFSLGYLFREGNARELRQAPISTSAPIHLCSTNLLHPPPQPRNQNGRSVKI